MWNALHGEMHSIPEPFDPSREIDWVLAEPLGSGAPKYLPAEFVYFSYPLHGPAWCQADSNGCAAGRSPSQATLRAVLECIERDALAIWWYNRLRRPAVALAAHGDPRLQPIVDAFAASSRRFWLLDITTDLHVPCYVAVSARPDGSELFFGAAADLCAHDAILRAASELSQVWFWSTHTQPHPEFAAWLTTATLTTDPYFQPCGETAPGFTDRLPDGEALARCIARLQFAGIHPLCVDLTRPEIGLAVKRVVAPGLRHFWGRFAPGRLYDVPVRQGWLTHPLAEEALNPVPCML
jgi:ribosomal protein S12 methylthiotransferase accessory factor